MNECKEEINMSVPVGKRNESKIEFDNTYYKVYDDSCDMVDKRFGATAKQQIVKIDYIQAQSESLMKYTSRLLYYIRLANSLYPTNSREYEERRLNMDLAIGVCYAIVTLYQLTFHRLHINEQRYVYVLQNLQHEINCIKAWRKSDNKRFKNLG